MNTIHWQQHRFLPIFLVALMVLTRFHHFGDTMHLPDASLAVFFFAGCYRRISLFGFLLLLAALIDYLAISNGTSAFCVSPAYVFLIPTYGVMWIAGRYSAQLSSSDRTRLLLSFAVLILAVTLAFIISNGSFYLFSDRYQAVHWVSYVRNTSGYFIPYAGAAIGYVAVVYGVTRLVRQLPGLISKTKEV